MPRGKAKFSSCTQPTAAIAALVAGLGLLMAPCMTAQEPPEAGIPVDVNLVVLV